ncbi:hypothetical protein NDM229_018355 [Acinetobacter bereziniae]|nr:hypothetical protein NDM229_018355 [Acinetobacter bereziniae]
MQNRNRYIFYKKRLYYLKLRVWNTKKCRCHCIYSFLCI